MPALPFTARATSRRLFGSTENREFAEVIAKNVKRIADFLNKFGPLPPQPHTRTPRSAAAQYDLICCGVDVRGGGGYGRADTGSAGGALDISTRYQLAKLNEKLTSLERNLDFLEAKIEMRNQTSVDV